MSEVAANESAGARNHDEIVFFQLGIFFDNAFACHR
jgi:hypothetical protein